MKIVKETWNDYYSKMLERLANEALKAYFADIFTRQYVYLKKHSDPNSFIPYVHPTPDALTDIIGINEAIPRNLNKIQLITWIKERVAILPIVPARFN